MKSWVKLDPLLHLRVKSLAVSYKLFIYRPFLAVYQM